MTKPIIILLLMLPSLSSYAQIGYKNYNDYHLDFIMLMDTFQQNPTNKTSNEKVFNQLSYLHDEIQKATIDSDEREKLQQLKFEIETVTKFIAPISNRYNAQLTDAQFSMLQRLFGQNLTKTKLNVKCPSDEVEFIEMRLRALRICYLHNISTKTKIGLIVKYHAALGNSTCNGEYGAFNNGYTHVLDNVGQPYLKMLSATIIKRN